MQINTKRRQQGNSETYAICHHAELTSQQELAIWQPAWPTRRELVGIKVGHGLDGACWVKRSRRVAGQDAPLREIISRMLETIYDTAMLVQVDGRMRESVCSGRWSRGVGGGVC